MLNEDGIKEKVSALEAEIVALQAQQESVNRQVQVFNQQTQENVVKFNLLQGELKAYKDMLEEKEKT